MNEGTQTCLGLLGDMLVASVGLRIQAGKSAKMKRLAVLPVWQGRGIGRQMAAHAESVAIRNTFRTMEIGIIAEHATLLDWYRNQGYVELQREVIPHLPFTVLTMIKDLA
jgi:GNAT superfamily N-acetyltransferase